MKSLFLILSILLCSGIKAQNRNLNISRWHLSDKIESSDYQLIRKVRLYYFISNDYDNLYIDIKVDDPGVQQRILKEGLTLWIDMNGTEVKKMGIRFPLGSKNQTAHWKTDSIESNPEQDGSLTGLLAMANTIEITGFINEQQRRFPSENRDSFRGSVKFDEKRILHYKMIMPLAKLPVRNAKEGHSARPFNLGIEYGSLPSANQSGVNRGPAPTSIFHSKPAGGGTAELFWIKDVKLATSK